MMLWSSLCSGPFPAFYRVFLSDFHLTSFIRILFVETDPPIIEDW